MKARLMLVAGAWFLAVVACATTHMTPNDRLFRSKCGACHPRPEPGSLSAHRWNSVLQAHRKRMTLSDEEVQRLQKHLSEEGMNDR